ncbi:hypothetical protein LINPERPRIM_LOCUS28377 [Linum perenne]
MPNSPGATSDALTSTIKDARRPSMFRGSSRNPQRCTPLLTSDITLVGMFRSQFHRSRSRMRRR